MKTRTINVRVRPPAPYPLPHTKMHYTDEELIYATNLHKRWAGKFRGSFPLKVTVLQPWWRGVVFVIVAFIIAMVFCLLCCGETRKKYFSSAKRINRDCFSDRNKNEVVETDNNVQNTHTQKKLAVSVHKPVSRSNNKVCQKIHKNFEIRNKFIHSQIWYTKTKKKCWWISA